MEPSETTTVKPIYTIATVRASGNCSCSCEKPVNVAVAPNAAIEAITDLDKAKMKVEKLGPDINLLIIE